MPGNWYMYGSLRVPQPSCETWPSLTARPSHFHNVSLAASFSFPTQRFRIAVGP
jgi:hypothetical protein